MANLLIRNFEDELKTELRVRAARGGRSMEEEARQILRRELAPQGPPKRTFDNLADAIRTRFEPFGGVDLDIPPRTPMREPPDFGGGD